MNINNHKSIEGALFEEWSKWLQLNHPEHGFMYDGIVSKNDWESATPKILFLLKDYNESSGKPLNLSDINLDLKSDRDRMFNLRWYLKNTVKEPSRWRTWDNIARWTYGLLHSTEDSYPNYWKEVDKYGKADKRADVLKYIAVMDIKKKPGSSRCSIQELKKYLSDYPFSKKYLARQLCLYNDADYVICCGEGLFQILQSIIDENHLESRQSKYQNTSSSRKYCITKGGKIIIDYRHPLLLGKNARKEIAYKELMEIVQIAKSQHDQISK